METCAVAQNPAAKEESVGGVIMPYEIVSEYFVEELGEIPAKPIYTVIKRAFDIVGSLIALAVLFIPMIIIAVIVRLDSPGPTFYVQDRLGLNGKRIGVIKLRTMYVDAEQSGAQWSNGKDDPRITPFGRILRRTRLDEIPQFWQTLIGEMSIIGPRPEREIFYDRFETYIHGFRQRLRVKPGITGLAQVMGGYDLKPEEKIVYDIEYIKNRSVWLDIKIMFMTVKVILTHSGAK